MTCALRIRMLPVCLLIVLSASVFMWEAGSSHRPAFGLGTITELVSGAGDNGGAAVSSNGRYVAFQSSAELAASDTNTVQDVYVRDRSLQKTELISVDNAGHVGNDASFAPAISANGCVVAFTSFASNLVPGDTNQWYDTFVRDRCTGTTERVSVDSTGAQSLDVEGSIQTPAVSGDGNVVAFGTFARLASSDTNSTPDAYVHNRTTGVTQQISVSTSGDPASGGGGANGLAINADGSLIAFVSQSSNLGASAARNQVYLRDLTNPLAPTTTVASVDAAGNPGTGDSLLPSMDTSGQRIAFESDATNLVSGDTNATTDIFVRDRTAGTTTRVDVSSAGAEANGFGAQPAIAGDGSLVAFLSSATNLVPGDTNGFNDIFVHELGGSHSTTRADVSTNGTQSNFLTNDRPSLAADGSIVAFASQATNLLDGGGPTSANSKLFAHGAAAPDATAPAINIDVPRDGATYAQNQVVPALYSCGDGGGSGLATCAGPVPSGTAIDTSTLGDQSFVVNASDNAGNASGKTVTYHVIVGAPPAFTSADTAEATTNTPFQFLVSTSGLPTPTLSASSIPPWVNYQDNGDGTALLTGTPTIDDVGSAVIALSADNGLAPSANQSLELTVQPPPPPACGTLTDCHGNSSSTSDGTASATTDGGSIAATTTGIGGVTAGTYTTDPVGAPSFVATNRYFDVAVSSPNTFSSLQIRDCDLNGGNGIQWWDPTQQAWGLVSNQVFSAGPPACVTATVDATTTPTLSQLTGTVLAVAKMPPAPIFTSRATSTAVARTPFSFPVTTFGVPTASVTESGTLPAHMTFTAHANGTATIAGTPAAGSGGKYTLTLTAKNGVKPNATQQFTLTVNEGPTITSAASAATAAGHPFSFKVTTSGFPAPRITETGTLPDLWTFHDNGDGTATFSGKPRPSGTYVLAINASNGIGPDATQSFTLTVQ